MSVNGISAERTEAEWLQETRKLAANTSLPVPAAIFGPHQTTKKNRYFVPSLQIHVSRKFPPGYLPLPRK